MKKKSLVMLIAIPLLTMSPVAFSASPGSLDHAIGLVKSGDVKYIAAVVLSRLPKSMLEAAPKSFITYNALRVKNNGVGGGVGGGRWHKC